ncbi:hypothetical protein [Microbacterium gallinarum]|uniref:Uncharacterized protein n=1 Tax=Microbacterium gallinarum TaxID=2762209 RepID=A0ABR8X4M9_9MICO|nr:hypothetical protein [Microbacterium gallinarum]MBD8023861.1 hypothetical protein [Microbacterium gallinarum]
MLVIDRIFRRTRRDDEGAVLITVVVVMLVGFIVASVVAASVLFTIQANAHNRSQTQSFVAAESGRDVAVAAIAAGCTGTSFSGTDPQYTSTIYTTSGNQPSSAVGLTPGCPTSSTRFIVIRSTGTGTDGSTSTIDSVYPWQVTYSQQPGGVVTYFSGGFQAGLSHYTGDLVLRDGSFHCNNAATLTGDLYVLTGDVDLSSSCVVEGDVWSDGYVKNGSSAAKITGSITSNSYVSLSSNGATSVGKDINAIGQVTLSNQGNDAATVGGNVTSRNTITVGSNWTVSGTGTPNVQTVPGFTPTFEPTLDWLKAATKWIDLSNASGFGTSYSGTCNVLKNNANPSLTTLLQTAGSKIVFDFTGCSTGPGQSSVDIALGNVNLARDAVFIVKPGATMNVNLSGTLTSASGTRQLLFIHSDESTAYRNGEPAPDCGNGGNGAGMKPDGFDVSGTHTGDVRIMVYSPCGLTGNVNSSFSGQLYTNDSTKLKSTGNIQTAYTCQPMSWSPAFDQLGCKIKGSGGVATGTLVQRIGSLLYQTEL